MPEIDQHVHARVDSMIRATAAQGAQAQLAPLASKIYKPL